MPLIIFRKTRISEIILDLFGYDPYWENVVLLTHLNNGVTDAKNHAMSAGASTNSTSTFKFGDSSRGLNGAQSFNAATHPDFALTGDFTIEGWINFSAIGASGDFTPANQYIFDFGANSFVFGWWGQVGWRVFTSGNVSTPEIVYNPSVLPAINTWHNWVVQRTGTTLELFLNGQLVGTKANFTNTVGSGVNLNFGNYGGGGNYGVNGFLDEIRITKGIARYSNDFTIQSAEFKGQLELDYDWFWDKTVLAIKGGNNGEALNLNNKTFIDSSDNNLSIATYGNATQGSVSPFNMAGSGSVYLDGVGDYLTCPTGTNAFNLANADFTIDLWFKPANTTSSPGRIFNGYAAGSSWAAFEILQGGDSIHVLASDTSSASSVYIVGSSATLTAGQWAHIAFVRNGNVFSLYINGVLAGSQTQAISLYNPGTVTIGARYYASYIENCVGHISNLRITKEQALYTTNFNVPTEPLTADSNTSLLLKFEGAGVVDETRKNNIELFGNTALNVSTKRFGVGSVVFDGTDDYAVAKSPDYAFGLGDFTIEGYARRESVGQGRGIFRITDQYLKPAVDGLALASTHTIPGKIQFFYANTYVDSSSFLVSDGIWFHFAVCRRAGITKVFYDGVEIISVADNTNYTGTYLTLGGHYSSPYLWHGFIDDFRITKGVARYTKKFTPKQSEIGSRSPQGQELTQTSYDPYWKQSVLAMPFNNNVKEYCGKTVTIGAATTFSTDSKFGSHCAVFNGDLNSRCTVPASVDFNFGTSDLTIEAWLTWDGTYASNGRVIAATGGSGSLDQFGMFWINNEHTLGFGGVTSTAINPSVNQWFHVAATRKDGIIKIFLDGVLVGSGAQAASIGSSINTLYIGGRLDNHPWLGKIDDLRITKGVARYTDNFNVATSEIPLMGASF